MKNNIKISNQIFKNKIDLKPYIKYDALPGRNFINCKFEESN